MSIIERLRRFFIRRPPAGAAEQPDTGAWGEQIAEQHLRRKNYTILGRRVRVRRDELDLVTRAPDGVIVFVEVKTRANEDFGRPFFAIDQRKKRALSRAAWNYLVKMRPRPEYFRFDVVEVVGTPAGHAPVVRHIEQAFSFMGKKRWRW